MNVQTTTSFQAKTFQRSVRETQLRGRDVLWKMLVVLLVMALASESFDEHPYLLAQGVSVPWPRFMFVFLLTFAVFIMFVLGRRIYLNMPAVYQPLFLFWCANQLSIIGILWMGAESSKLLQFIETDVHLTIYIVFVYALLKLADWDRFRFLLRVYYGLGIVAAIVAIMQFVHGNFGWFSWMSNYLFESRSYLQVGFRTSSIFGEPMWAARYYVHWIALSLAFYSYSRKRRYIALLLLFGLVFYMAASLLGYLMLSGFVLILLLSQMRGKALPVSRQAKVVAFLAGDLLVCILLLSIMFEQGLPVPHLLETSIERAGEVLQGRGGAGNRIDGIQAGLRVWQESPLFGVGLGNNYFYIYRFYTDPAFVVRSRFDTDSMYTQMLSEKGLVGLVAFLYFLARMIRTPRTNLFPVALTESRDREAYILLRFLQMDLVAQAVGMVNYSDLLAPHLWVIVAIVLVLQQVVLKAHGMVNARETGSNGRVESAQEQWSL